jgi:LPS-assembly protein
MAVLTTARPPDASLLRWLAPAAFTFVILLGVAFPLEHAVAQRPEPAWVGVPARPPQAGTASGELMGGGRADPTAQMLVQANEIHYDYANERVAAVGMVQIHYAGSVLEADRVTYDQRTKRLHAEGNVRLTEADGKIVNAQRLDLNEHFRDGFVDSLHLETADKTRLAAARADRTEGRLTVFQSGVYTACEPCRDNPQAPPKWQVKAARILHDEAEKMIYFEDARLELFGFPIAYFPYLWTPDPTVKRKTGFLQPNIVSGTKFGFGATMPFFWVLAPDYDVTLTPMPTTKQGLMMIGEWRQRLINGAYSIRAAGIFQEDKNTFAGQPGFRDFRGAVETKGDFRLSEKWFYGWDASIFTDSAFAPDYKVIKGNAAEAVSQAYLFGRGAKSYFDARFLHFYGFSALDNQRQLPFVTPLVDYKYVYGSPVFGGELGYNVNVTSLNRRQADFDPITATAAANGWCDLSGFAALRTPANCLLRGIPGTYSRVSAEAYWKRTFIDPFGQMFTPFVSLRGDAAAASITPEPAVGNFIKTGDSSLGRGMAAVGVEYRYPFISTHSWGTQTIEPIAQVIARPNESQIGRFPNEDSQSFLFDDANLFSINKYAGWDRVEGGGRANVGAQYTAQFNKGGYFNALFGQSYHLFGTNSFAVADMANTGLNSGLETRQSDYVARATFQPNKNYTFLSRFRFDEQNFDVRRLELEGRVNFDRWTAALTYGNYDAQPIIGMLLPREGIAPSGSVKITQNWTVSASALYSIDSNRLNTATVGVGYIDECIALNAFYATNYGYRGDIVPNSVFLLQVNLRTFGGTSVSQVVGGPSSTTNNVLGLTF